MTSSGWALPDGGPLLAGDGEYGGLSPEDIRSAYDIPALGGAGRTVAVISLGSYSAVESELAIYREAYGLSVCDKANGCLAIVNEKGEESPLPGQTAFGAYIEQGLDVEMVSAVCPECHILIVDAKEGKKNTDMKAIAAANEEAAKLNATVISNSLSFPETNKEECGETGCTQYNSDYTHFVQPTVANAGDAGYENGGAGDSYPAAVPRVVAVGGTVLHRAENARGWSEEVWEGTGSGCSKFEAKPVWQTDPGCTMRTTNDVAAVAYGVSGHLAGAWGVLSGTSVSTPIIAGILAQANGYTRVLSADAFYKDTSMFDVTSGKNGECPAFEYLCTGEIGYNGPTGNGTPDGIPEIAEPHY